MTLVKIGIYGRMNVGKSTLLNHILGHNVAVVSPEPGTTTDPVRRRFEILDFAPVLFIDTAGFDDSSVLGKQRIIKTLSTLSEVDLAMIVIQDKPTVADLEFVSNLTCPYIYIVSKVGEEFSVFKSQSSIIEAIKATIPLSSLIEPPFFGGRLGTGDTVILVCPIDGEAPSGRLILPQVQALRAALDLHAAAIVVQVEELGDILKTIKPKLIVTDSQVFDKVSPLITVGVELTSFSILLAERKGDIKEYIKGIEALSYLQNGDHVVMVEHCSHQSSCEDIAREKIPRLMRAKLGVDLEFKVVNSLSEDIQADFVVQCGGCMVGRRAVVSNIQKAASRSIPITNYGLLLRELLKK